MSNDNENLGEKLFVEVCKHQGWKVQKVPVRETKTPDFDVTTSRCSFIAEVKQFEYDYELGKAYSYTLGEKVRGAISNAKKQLQGHEKQTMLAICDTRGMGLTSFENVVSAMYGELTVKINKETGKFGSVFHGRNSKLRAELNTSISAVAVVSYSGSSEADLKPYIKIYHNMYAKYPFERGAFASGSDLSEHWFEEERVVV